MSAGYGFFGVKFFKADGTPDSEAAKKALDWAQENLDWVKELKPFVLDGNEWSNNSDDWADGVDIKHTGVPNEPRDWIKEVGDAAGAELVTAVELQDFTESAMDNIGSYAAVYKNGKIIGTSRFHKGDGSACDSDDEDDENERDFFSEADDWASHYVPEPKTEPIPDGCFVDNHGNWGEQDSARYNIVGCPGRDFALLPVRAMITDDEEQWDLIAEFGIEKDEVPDLPFITMYDEEFQDYEVEDGEEWLQLGYGSGDLLDANGNTIQSLKDVDHADNEDGETVFWRVPFGDLDEEERNDGECVLTPEAEKKWCEKLGISPFVIEDGVLTEYKGKDSSVVIPEGVTKIGKKAFDGCTSLASITIPASVTEIGEDAFSRCTALAEIRYAGSKEQWEAVEKGVFWHQTTPAVSVVCDDGRVDLPLFDIEGTVLVSYNGIAGSVELPETVTEIGPGAFGATPIETITIPKSVTKIGEGAFWNTPLKSVTIPESVTEIGSKAFYLCDSLAEIHYTGTKDQWAAVTKGESWNLGVLANEVLVRKQ